MLFKDYISIVKDALCKGRQAELEDVTLRRNKMRKGYEFLRKSRLAEFMAGFTVISNKLKEMYQMITLGGDAEFELVDSLDPFSDGIIFRSVSNNCTYKFLMSPNLDKLVPY